MPLCFWIPFLFVGLMLGCQRGPNQVEFVVPDGFRGGITIIPDHRDGVLPKERDGRFVVMIPESGVLKMEGEGPFGSYLPTARFANGDPIWVEKHGNDRPGRSEIGLFGGVTCIDHTSGTGRRDVSIRWFIGTEEEWRAVGQAESTYLRETR